MTAGSPRTRWEGPAPPATSVGPGLTVGEMTVAHPITHAWLSTGSTGAQNYDEFATDDEITEIIAKNPASALAIEMPHRAPESLGRSFEACLPAAAERLAAARAAGRFSAADDIVAVYRITAPDGPVSYGLWCMVDTDQISTSADEPGLVIRNEDVFAEKVRERVALATTVRALLSPVLLLQTANGDELQSALARTAASAGTPAVVDVDQAGRIHETWAIGPGRGAVPDYDLELGRDELLKLAGGGELVVADGNHRSLAAQQAGLPRFLAVITVPDSVSIQPYNRLVRLPAGTGAADLVAGLPGAVRLASAARSADTASPTAGGSVHLVSREGAWAVPLPRDESGRPADTIDHAIVERVLFRGLLGMDPGDKRITYVGGDYPASWLCGEVRAGRADLAVLMAPVTVGDFVAVNLARDKMPRKSTWFTPKARAGLVVAEISL